MSAADDALKTTMLKSSSPIIAEALEPRAPQGKLTRVDEAEGVVGEFWLEQRTQTVGRDASNPIALDVPGISRTHARIYSDSGGWMVEDLGSRNGVWINDVRIEQPRWMSDGDVVRFSQVALRLDLVDPEGSQG